MNKISKTSQCNIPKTLHYCWFSGDKKPKMIQSCIDSWKRTMPEYDIRCWDGNSFDFDSVPFVHDAMAAKKYDTAADYVRLYALYTEGGIYLDSDVEVFKSFDPFLNHQFFCGTENYYNLINPEPAIMGSQAKYLFLKECLDFYLNTTFVIYKETTTMPIVMGKIMERYNYLRTDAYQELSNHITIYPTSYFCNILNQEKIDMNRVYALHKYAKSWVDEPNRGFFYKFCKKHDLLDFYHKIENPRSK
jgi:mannosyltransferase OCH1-like enzyme